MHCHTTDDETELRAVITELKAHSLSLAFPHIACPSSIVAVRTTW
jgi:hypothetical protein